jgi:hypothetical protein
MLLNCLKHFLPPLSGQVDFAFPHQCVPDAEWTKKMSRLRVVLDCA